MKQRDRNKKHGSVRRSVSVGRAVTQQCFNDIISVQHENSKRHLRILVRLPIRVCCVGLWAGTLLFSTCLLLTCDLTRETRPQPLRPPYVPEFFAPAEDENFRDILIQAKLPLVVLISICHIRLLWILYLLYFVLNDNLL